MFELLMSVDMMVLDFDGMMEKLVDKFGVYKYECWCQVFDNYFYIVYFLCVYKFLVVVLIWIELQWYFDKFNFGDLLFYDFLESFKDFQGYY